MVLANRCGNREKTPAYRVPAAGRLTISPKEHKKSEGIDVRCFSRGSYDIDSAFLAEIGKRKKKAAIEAGHTYVCEFERLAYEAVEQEVC